MVISVKKYKNKTLSKNKTIRFIIIYILSMLLILVLQFLTFSSIYEKYFVLIFENITIISVLLHTVLTTKTKIIEDNINSMISLIPELENKNELVKASFEIYKDLQIACMNFDYDKIKELVSDEIYNMYVNQLETLKIKNQQNIMSDIEFKDGRVISYYSNNFKDIYEVYLTVSCHDYIINTKTNKVVRGNKYKKLILSYILTFEKNKITTYNCPQCGADVKDLTECEYCKSKIVNNTSKMKMTKKEIKSQK